MGIPLCSQLDLSRVDPCDEWYLAGHLVGAVHDRLLTRRLGRGGGALHFAKSKGGYTPAVQRGQQEHAKFAQRVEQKAQQTGRDWRAEEIIKDPNTGESIRVDARTPSGNVIELKPNTPSGRKRGEQQLKKYLDLIERVEGRPVRGRVVYY